MTQMKRSRTNDHPSGQPLQTLLPALLTLLLLAALLAACNASVGAGAGTGRTRIGGSVGSSGSIVGIGTSMGPGLIVSAHGDQLLHGPSDVRNRHKNGIKALQNADYDLAASLFGETLKTFPEHPDATYYLGLSRIYQGQREAGFALLKQYREPDYYRMTTDVQRMAEFLEKRPDTPAETVHETLNRYRMDGYKRDQNETRDTRVWN